MRAKWSMLFGPEGSIILWPKGSILFGQRGQICLAFPALIASGVYPDYVWLATGGKSQLSIDKLKVLQGRTVVMFPDVDGFEYWSNKAKEVEAIGCKVVVSDLLEKNATDEDRANKIDIADWLIRCLSESTVTEVKTAITETEKILQAMIEANPALQLLIDTFDLELVV